MPRIRQIKPETWDDEILGSVSRDARLLFVGSWNFADDEGRIRWTAASLKSKIFPYDEDLTIADVQGMMDELEAVGRVRSYVISGAVSQTFAVVVNFARHQVINRPRPSSLPAPPRVGADPDPGGGAPVPFSDDAVSDEGVITDDSLAEGEGEGVNNNPSPQLVLVPTTPKRKPRTPSADGDLPGFTIWWEAYPRKTAKIAARKAYAKTIKAGITSDHLLTAVRRFAATRKGEPPRFTCHPATWLNEGRYDDEPEVSGTFTDAYGNVMSRVNDPWGRHA